MLPSGREFILRYEASRAVRPYTVVRPYRVFESRLWADCSLTAEFSARTIVQQDLTGLWNKSVDPYCKFGKFC